MDQGIKNVFHLYIANRKSSQIVKFCLVWQINPGTVGYYRVRYPAKVLEQFVPAIMKKTLSPLDRLGLVDDLFAM